MSAPTTGILHTDTVGRPPHGGRRTRFTLSRRGGGPRRIPWLWILPGLVIAVVIQFAPVVSGGYYSFTSWSGIGAAHWIGLHNFSAIFKDPQGVGSLEHTVELGAAFVVFTNIFGLALAVGLGNALKSRNVLRALFFLPVVMTPLATSYVWAFIFQYTGPLNGALGAVGLHSLQQTWLASPTWALWTILVVLVWQNTGLSMVIYMAGLQAIPAELEEAAAVDGASAWYRFRRVTLPMLLPAIAINLTLTMIYALRVFDQILALTNGGPFGASQTLATEVWQQTFVNDNYGYGAALALLLTILVAIIGVAQLGLLRVVERRSA